MGAGTLRDLSVCGRGTFFDELLELAGGINAVEVMHAYPSLSPETVISLHPDLILEIAPDLEERELDTAAIAAEWHAVPGLEHVVVRVLSGDHVAVPGPRFVQTVGDMSAAVAEAVAK
jgi:iron complex transport system substrate-binding protein